ncbi:MAG: hypothetical protein HY925_06230 [Elusimicrobia bacterium]|nr:hypothetical protein [Elusimicrobiota bacterium]
MILHSLRLAAALALAQMSSGGIYTLEKSGVGPGDKLSGGNFDGQGFVEGMTASQQNDGLRLVGGAFEARVGFMNPPPFLLNSSASAVVPLAGGLVSMSVPAGAIPLTGFDLIARQDPASNPVTVDPNAVLRANNRLAINDPLSLVQVQNVFEFKVASDLGYYESNFAAPVMVSFSYTDADADGVIDGTNPPIRASLLNVWTLDETLAQWIRVPGANVDSVAHTVSVPVRHFSVYAFAAASDQNVDGVYAFPVPFRPNGPDAGLAAGQTGTEAGGITFSNLPTDGSIEIYTMTGQLVRRIEIPPSLAIPKYVWDVRNDRGQAVVSGVYIWKVASRTAHKTGRLMVIR